MTVQLIEGGEDLPVELEDAKLALRIEDGSENNVVERSLHAAAEFFEDATNRAVRVGTYEQTFDDWPCGPLVLERAPVREIVAVEYLDAQSKAWTPLGEGAVYLLGRKDGLSEVRFERDQTKPALASRLGNVRVSYVAGYSPTRSTESERRFRIPRKVEQCLLLLTGHWFENREESSDRPSVAIVKGAEAIIKQSRIFR